MDLLSTIGLITKRRGDYFAQAESLAKKTKSREKLEQKMLEEAKVIVKGFRDKQFRWDEYERTLVDKTLTSALAAVYLGAGSARPKDKMEKSWPTLVGNLIPPLLQFLTETKTYLDNGALILGDKTLDFADSLEDLDLDEIEDQGIENAKTGRAQGKTWPGLLGRVVRYIATPVYQYFNLGNFFTKQEQGFSEMRRIARRDAKVCNDCVSFANQGWVPIGELPMPGNECRCYDRCRCSVEYR